MKNLKNIIGIWGTPRSGTTWIGQIFNSSLNTVYRYQPLFSYKFKNFLSEDSSRDKISTFFNEISNSDDDFLRFGLSKEEDKNQLKFKKNISTTHLVFKNVRYHHIIENLVVNSDIKIIGIIRNPCGVINSWLKAPKEFDPSWDYMKEWNNAQSKNKDNIEESYGFKKWKETTLAFHHLSNKYPKRVFLLKYEDLVANPLHMTENIFSFVNLKMDNQVIDFLNNSNQIHNEDDYSVFKNKSVKDKWKNQLDNRIIKSIFDDLKGTELEVYLG